METKSQDADKAARPRPRDTAATRAALLDAARTAFTRRGFEATGVREIAEIAGVDKALITRYFGSKEALFAEAVPAMFDASPLIDGARADFGVRAMQHLLDPDRASGFNPTLALLRSLSDPRAAQHLSAGLERRLVAPLAAWLGGEQAHLRAAVILAQLAGYELTINILRLKPLASGRCAARLAALLAPALQRLVDDPAPTKQRTRKSQ